MSPEEAFRAALGDRLASLDGETVDYLLGMIEEGDCLDSLEELNENLGPFLVSSEVVESEEEAEEICKRMFDSLSGAAAPKKEEKKVLNAPVNLAAMAAQEDARVAKLVESQLTFNKCINPTYQAYAVLGEEFEGDDEEKLKFIKSMIKGEKKAQSREKNIAMSRSAILAQLTTEPVVVHKSANTDLTGSRDIVCNGFGINLDGLELLVDTDLTIAHGRRYGLVGKNGEGKTTLLKHIAGHALEGIPKHLQILHIEQEVSGGDESVLDMVLKCDVEREILLEEQAELMKLDEEMEGKDDPDALDRAMQLKEVMERLDEIDADDAPRKAAAVLRGLGFDEEMQKRPTKTFSGGWRMRVSLARALFISPDIMLLDEPTNHLDLHAVMWLEMFLNQWPKTVVIVSHAREFLNNVVTDIVHLHHKKLKTYRGDYTNFEKVRMELIRQQNKQAENQAKQREHIQDFVDKMRAKAKGAKMAQSRIKTLEKMVLIPEIHADPTITFKFPPPGDQSLNQPLQMCDVSFRYGPDYPFLFKMANVGVQMGSRIALVGPNGIGKSTMLKVLFGDLTPVGGMVLKNPKLKLGRFSQHHVDDLSMAQSALEHMKTVFPDAQPQQLRSHLGGMGIKGNTQLQPIQTLSGGQKSRVAFAKMSFARPHILLVDEPTNHLDLDTVTALIQALDAFEGGILVVSHDEHLISAVCDELWLIEDQQIKILKGDFDDYKKVVRQKVVNTMSLTF